MQIYKGINALSSFRQEKLLSNLQAIDKSVTAVAAEYVHFVATNTKLTAEGDKTLKQLLTYGMPFKGKRSGTLMLVMPRQGTISPWSSKATDIAKNTGLNSVLRLERGTAYYLSDLHSVKKEVIARMIYDPMTEQVLFSEAAASRLFTVDSSKPLATVDILKGGKAVLEEASKVYGLAIAGYEIDYLLQAYQQLKRNPTDVELMTFAQINSEHCRHKVFNAKWVVDAKPRSKSLFQMIKNTYEKSGDNVLTAYSDNASVLKGPVANWFFPSPLSKAYKKVREPAHLVIKVETHNHPTAVEPFSGAATGVGGEIRDEAATGRGGRSKMGLTGFTVSNLHLPDHQRPWENEPNRPTRIASALDIMIDAPLGGAAFANEFGRPNLVGYFRTYEDTISNQTWGYHKPIMIAGGLGNIRDSQVKKQRLPEGANLVVLGGPAMLIGLGGGSGSSMNSGENRADLDFASVQRANGEMERRDQEVINACWALGDKNPILSIHDVGAGGWSNALPELVHDSKRGAIIELRNLPNADPSLSPMEIWCNEAQERYVVGIDEKNLKLFASICERERCPFAVAGLATKAEDLVVTDNLFNNQPLNVPMSLLFGNPPKLTREFTSQAVNAPVFDPSKIKLAEAIKRVLQLPAVGSKKFLITIGDRTVGGLTVRDQMVGPWQVPVSDVSVTASSFDGETGEAMCMGERPAIAIVDAPASARMAIGEALTNMMAADVRKLSDVKLSANWMAAIGAGAEDEKLYSTVKAVGEDFCPALGVTIPVGKDSLSMRTVWQDKEKPRSVTSPLSLIVTAFALVRQLKATLTPQLDGDDSTVLILIDLGQGRNRLGGSALAQVYNQVGNLVPDVSPLTLKQFFKVIQKLKQQNYVLAYHDRSDGGLLASLCEMSFASHCGLKIKLDHLPGTTLEKLFSEELGAVIQVKKTKLATVLSELETALGKNTAYVIGQPLKQQRLQISDSGKLVYENTRSQLETWWSETSYLIQSLRDNPLAAKQEFMAIQNDKDPGLTPKYKFSLSKRTYKTKPKLAILREQGVNGQTEMAAAFNRAGFNCFDVHLNDLLSGTHDLADFAGLAACGGFSYGDVLGAGEGWAKTILFHPSLRKQFEEFFSRPDSFSLGVCNGCQMLSALKELIPGAEMWPRFLKNQSEQFEARLILTEIRRTPSILFKGMEGAYLEVPVAHGEGRAVFETKSQMNKMLNDQLVVMQYVDNGHNVTADYPANPNGSSLGIAGLTSTDGRATIMMPHPERAFMSQQLSWHPKHWETDSPWLQLFLNARAWLS